MSSWMTARRRAWLYGLATVTVPLLIAYDALDAERAPLWLALAAAFLGVAAPATALANITPDPVDYATADEPEIGVE